MNKEDFNRPKTEEDDGGQHMMGRVIQNFQFAARARGLNLGPVSANEILEMADKGKLKGMEESVEIVRGWVANQDSKSSTPSATEPESSQEPMVVSTPELQEASTRFSEMVKRRLET